MLDKQLYGSYSSSETYEEFLSRTGMDEGADSWQTYTMGDCKYSPRL